MSEQTIIYFALGPVQSFIASARTSRDLWAGSRLLSYLTQEAQTYFVSKGQAAPLYPDHHPPTGKDFILSSFPNKFSVIVAGDLKQATDLAATVETRVRARWQDIAETVHSELKNLAPQTVGWDRLWAAQIEGLLEIYWAGATVVANDLITAREEAATLLDARKRLRHFPYYTSANNKREYYTGDSREKDTLDGLLEQMGPRIEDLEVKRRNQTTQFWQDFQTAVNQKQAKGQGQNIISRLSRNERLSAVNLVKRFCWDYFFRPEAISSRIGLKLSEARLPMRSTADVAVGAWRSRLAALMAKNTDLLDQVKSLLAGVAPFAELTGEGLTTATFIQRFEQLDGRYFYLEFYDKEPDTELTVAEQSDQVRIDAKKALSDFCKFLRENEQYRALKSPPRYFAVLRLDGDRMGSLVSASPNPQDISQQLVGFARYVQKIKDKYYASVIYTGGDDALLLLPCENLLACANELRTAYMGLGLRYADDEAATVSMGAAIAHYKYPLQKTLVAAGQAEQRAKGSYDRDALALTILKRSGETIETGGKWQTEATQVFQVLDELRLQFQAGLLSTRLPYRLSQTVAPLLESGLYDPLLAEFARLYQRHRNESGLETQAQKRVALETGAKPTSPLVEAEIKQLKQSLTALQTQLASIARLDFKNFCNLMLAAAFLAREWEANE